MPGKDNPSVTGDLQCMTSVDGHAVADCIWGIVEYPPAYARQILVARVYWVRASFFAGVDAPGCTALAVLLMAIMYVKLFLADF